MMGGKWWETWREATRGLLTNIITTYMGSITPCSILDQDPLTKVGDHDILQRRDDSLFCRYSYVCSPSKTNETMGLILL
jgi:hypothetical protein